MKIIRYQDRAGKIGHATQEADGTFREAVGDLSGGFRATGVRVEPAKVLAPLQPVNILCIGLNYRRHAAETGSPIPALPVLFMKATSALQNPGDPILLPRHLESEEVDYECELAVVIGRRAKNVPRARALEHVFGYTCANDVSARDWQIKRGGGQWCRGKTFDTFCPLGPCLVTREDIPNPNKLGIRTRVSGEVLQDWTTEDMIFDVPTLIEFLSGSTTLLPGTVILTGTPHGVSLGRKPPRWLRPGDRVEVEVEGIGVLANPVEEERVSDDQRSNMSR